MPFVRVVRFGLAAATLAACAWTVPAAGQGVADVQVRPDRLTLQVGEKAKLFASAFDRQGNVLPTAAVVFASSDTSVARVGEDGTVAGLKPGLTRVEARAQDRSAVVAVFVTSRAGPAPKRNVQSPPATPIAAPAPLSDFILRPAMLVRPPDALDTIVATAPAQKDRAIQSSLSWRVIDSTIARVGPTGIVQTLAPGETEIVAAGAGSAGPIERRVRLIVYRRPDRFVVSPRPSAGPLQLPAGTDTEIVTRAEAADSTPIPEAAPTWEVGDSTIATIDETNRLTAHRAGTTSLTARLPGFDAVIWVVTVVSGEIALTPAATGLAMDQRARLAGRFADADGVPAPLAWTSDRPNIVEVASDGSIHGLHPGRATITATAPWGRSARATVFVTGDLLLSSNRQAHGFGLYQLRLDAPDSLMPVLSDTAAWLQAAWSPDRTRIAASSNRDGNYQIVVLDADGTNPRTLAPDPSIDGEPAWTPDGERVVFSSTRGALKQVYSVGVDGGDLRALTSSPGGNSSPAVSPDGQTIAFISLRDGNYELYAMDAAGGNQHRVTNSAGREANPRFFPNGDLAFLTERAGRAGSTIMRRNADGTTTPLADTPDTILSFALSRDGSRIAYVTGKTPAGGKGRTTFALYVQPATAGATASPIPLAPGEQIVTPAF